MRTVKFYLLTLFVSVCIALYSSSPVLAQSESHNFTTYDTLFNFNGDEWMAEISRPVNLFTPGNPDTASRPLIISMPGVGQMGSLNYSFLSQYGPHYWLANGWTGGVSLGNGMHYPIIITVSHVTNTYPQVYQYYPVLTYILAHYHINPKAVYGCGLSMGAFTTGGMIDYEQTVGDNAGMKLFNAIVLFEGTPTAPWNEFPVGTCAYCAGETPAQAQWCDTSYFKVWATKYKGKLFYLEGSGSDNFRDGWHYATAMNDAVPHSAYFSYEDDGGGAHCCWNDFYNPATTNWTCVNPPGFGTYNSASQLGSNQMGNYVAPENVYQWLLRQGDTTLAGTGTPTQVPPTVSAGVTQTVTLPVSSVTLTGTAVANAGATISTTAWTETGGPNTATIASPSALSTSVTGLIAGTYTFQLMATDNNNESTESVGTVHVVAISPAVTMGADPTIVLPLDSATLTATDATDGGSAITETLWTEDSGPNTATIVTPSALSTSIKNMVVGSYSFRLTVTNAAGLSSSTSVGITVEPAPINNMSIPGTITASNYVSSLGVNTQPTSDVGGGLNVGWIDPGYWMEYNVNVATAGTYMVGFRLATPNTGCTLQLQTASGTLLATVNVPVTGGWQTWQTVTATATLPAGNQTLKIISTGTGLWNINWMNFAYDSSGPSNFVSIPGTITASDCIDSLGVKTQPTSDVGGGLNVGWIDPGDWMEYNVNAATAATYTVGFRIATPNTGCTLQLQTASGTVLATVNVPVTGGWQTWRTITATATLPAGNQTLKVVSTGTGMWNINWMNFGYDTTTTTAQQPSNTNDLSTAAMGNLADSASYGINLYPNPASNNVTLAINNSQTGKMVVQVVDPAGNIKKTYGLSKDGLYVGLSLYVGDLPPGVYFVRTQIGNWKLIQKLLKL